MKHTFYIVAVNLKVKRYYTTLGHANEGVKYKYPSGRVYGVNIIKGKPRVVARYYGYCEYELTEEERNIKLL